MYYMVCNTSTDDEGEEKKCCGCAGSINFGGARWFAEDLPGAWDVCGVCFGTESPAPTCFASFYLDLQIVKRRNSAPLLASSANECEYSSGMTRL